MQNQKTALGDSDVVISKEQLRILLEGLCVWNTVTVDSLTKIGREKLYKAQDLIEKLWNENK